MTDTTFTPEGYLFLISLGVLAFHFGLEGLAWAYHFLSPRIGKIRQGNPLALNAPHSEPGAHPQETTEAPILIEMSKSKPHLLIIGCSGGGKSMLARAFADYVAKKGAQIIALDPDAAPRHYPSSVFLLNEEDQWKEAIAALGEEFDSRNRQYREEEKEIFPPLWIVADECQELFSIEGIIPIIERIIRRGRKLNMHVLLAVQDSQVRTLNLERKSALLTNLSRIEISREGDKRIALLDGKKIPIPDFPIRYGEASCIIPPFFAKASQEAKREALQSARDADADADADIREKEDEKAALCAKILAEMPDISTAKLAQRLFGRATGNAFYEAKALREKIETIKEENNEN